MTNAAQGESSPVIIDARAKPATPDADDQSLSAKVWREARLVGGGLVSGIADGLIDKVHDPLTTATESVAAYWAGRGLAYVTKFGAPGKVAAAGIGAGLAVTSLWNSEDLGSVKTALGEAWTSENAVARHQQRVGSIIGSTAVDLSLNSVAGALGANQTIKRLAERTLLSQFERAQNSVVHIYAQAPGQSSSWAGSGFAAADRSIVSAHHVVEGGYVGRERVPGTIFFARSRVGEEYPLSIAHAAPASDLVVFRTAQPHGLPPLEISSLSAPAKGTPVVSLGGRERGLRAEAGTVIASGTESEWSSYYAQNTSKGQRFADSLYNHTIDRVVTLITGQPKEVFDAVSPVLLANAKVHGGMSGGPLISKTDGTVLGVNSWSQDGWTKFAGFSPAPAILEALAAAKKSV